VCVLATKLSNKISLSLSRENFPRLYPPYEVEDYYSSNASSPSLKKALQSKNEAECSKIIIMSVMTISTNNLEEEMAAMKAMLERLVKENEEKGAHIKL